MYYTEKLFYDAQVCPGQSKRVFEKISKKYRADLDHINDTEEGLCDAIYKRLNTSVSDNPEAVGSIYTQNEQFIDFRTPFDEKRGLLSLYALCATLIFFIFPVGGLLNMVPCLINGTELHGDSKLPFEGYIAFTFCSLVFVAVLIMYFWLIKRFFRLEMFVQRRLLIRFDRVNRKVYFHRPNYAGGIVSLDWDSCMYAGDGNGSNIGMPLIIYWLQKDTPNGRFETLMPGRLARTENELRDRWEYIRRFMQNCANDVQKQETISKIPWPWLSIRTSFGLMWPIFKMSGLKWMIPLVLLLTPVVLLYAIGNWFGLLLCWEPVFPKVIRNECGETFMSVIKARCIDIISISMLVATFWLIGPNFFMKFLVW